MIGEEASGFTLLFGFAALVVAYWFWDEGARDWWHGAKGYLGDLALFVLVGWIASLLGAALLFKPLGDPFAGAIVGAASFLAVLALRYRGRRIRLAEQWRDREG